MLHPNVNFSVCVDDMFGMDCKVPAVNVQRMWSPGGCAKISGRSRASVTGQGRFGGTKSRVAGLLGTLHIGKFSKRVQAELKDAARCHRQYQGLVRHFDVNLFLVDLHGSDFRTFFAALSAFNFVSSFSHPYNCISLWVVNPNSTSADALVASIRQKQAFQSASLYMSGKGLVGS